MTRTGWMAVIAALVLAGTGGWILRGPTPASDVVVDGHDHADDVAYYTCPMHPSVKAPAAHFGTEAAASGEASKTTPRAAELAIRTRRVSADGETHPPQAAPGCSAVGSPEASMIVCPIVRPLVVQRLIASGNPGSSCRV